MTTIRDVNAGNEPDLRRRPFRFDSRFDSDDLTWIENKGSPKYDYLIDYDIAVLGSQADIGRIDLLIRWAPHSFCHFHRHVASTSSLVLEGEHHLYEIDDDGNEVDHEVRPAGTYRMGPGGDRHMEQGGPDGSLVLFSMHEPTGRLFDVLDRNTHELIATATIDSLTTLAAELSHAAEAGR